MDQTQHTSLRSSNVHLKSFTHLGNSFVANHLPSPSLNQITSAELLGTNSDIFLPDISGPPNVCVMNPNLNESKATDKLNQLVQNNESMSNNDLNNTKLTDSRANQCLVKTKTKYQVEKTTQDLTKGVQLNESMGNKIVESISIETAVDNDGSYVTKGIENCCLICDINFWTEELLNTHLDGKEFSCRICTAEFIDHSKLKSHFLSHQRYVCIVCKKSLLCKEDLMNHRKRSFTCNTQFECDVCQKIFLSNDSVRKHKQYTHRTENNLNKCVVCDKTFVLQYQLNAHQNSCHVAYEKVVCKFCSLPYLGPEKLKNHVKHTHLKKREVCPFTCSICGKVLYLKSALEKHEKSHNEVKEMVVCEICGKSCSGKSGLIAHMKYNHKTVNEVIKCLKCSKEFKTKRMLNRHTNAAHKPKVPAVCEICGKTLKSKEQLKSHLLIHSSERQFKCDICDATFKQPVALNTHRRIHSGIRKYSCNDCGKSFRWKQTFDKHSSKCKDTQNN